MEFEPKPFEGYDVDIKIEYCGVCGSDLHTLRSGWVCSPVPSIYFHCLTCFQGPTMYPCIVGHEIVGKAVRVGAKVTTVNVGDTVGVGANAWSCGECHSCLTDNEQYCVSSTSALTGTKAHGT
jgi:alcohol dehydrogenase (NADP+)